MSLLDQVTKFAVNASLDALPTYSNLYKWRKGQVLSVHCVISQISHPFMSWISTLWLQSFGVWLLYITVLSMSYCHLLKSPSWLGQDISHVVECSDNPDIIWWDVDFKLLHILEVPKIPFEANIDMAALYKHAKKIDLMQPTIDSGDQFELITLEVGFRGLLNIWVSTNSEPFFDNVSKILNPSGWDALTKLLRGHTSYCVPQTMLCNLWSFFKP